MLEFALNKRMKLTSINECFGSHYISNVRSSPLGFTVKPYTIILNVYTELIFAMSLMGSANELQFYELFYGTQIPVTLKLGVQVV